MSSFNRPKIGLALRGASTRSMFYIGFLEVLDEQKIPIDYIATMSSGAIAAAAYACGTMHELKRQALTWDADTLYSLIDRTKNKGGLYSMEKGEEFLRQFTRNLRFEDVKPQMGFVTADINEGTEVVLQMGDIAKAICATCSVPGIFEPVQWGNKALVDGGLINVIPGNVLQEVGMDIAIGVDLRATNYIFSPAQYFIRQVVSWLRSLLLLNQAEKFGKWIEMQFEDSELFTSALKGNESAPSAPGMFSVIGRSMDLALAAQKRHVESNSYQCDILIRPETKKKTLAQRFFLLWLTDFSRTEEMYQLGRTTATEYAPKIWQAMADFESKKQGHEIALKEMIKHN